MENPRQRPYPGRVSSPIERLASFRFTYLAIFIFLCAYVFTVEGLEEALTRHFRSAVERAANVDRLEEVLTRHFRSAVERAANVDVGQGSLADLIQERVQEVLNDSSWVTLGVRVRPVVLGADGRTLLYAGGRAVPSGEIDDTEVRALLPPIVDVAVAVPHNALLANGILVAYAALLISVLYGYNGRLVRQELAELEKITAARDASAQRAAQIEDQLQAFRAQLAQLEPEKEEEVRALHQERAGLLERLAALEAQEEALRASSSKAQELEEEHQTLEELLDEALQDVDTRDQQIRTLQKQVKRSGKERGREAEHIGRRLRTLYKNLEVDQRALDDLATLGDEALRLKAEEAMKRLSDEPDSTAVRRKVGGLPSQLSIFELGFAGKGRIYYQRGKSRRCRVLLVGAKNSQKPDLEYLSRLSE